MRIKPPDLQSLPLAICHADTTIDELVTMLLRNNVRRGPIVDEDGQLNDIACPDDAMAALVGLTQRVLRALTGKRSFD